MSVAGSISFNNFCQLCTKISNAAHEKKFGVLRSYIDSWGKKAKELQETNPNINDSFFPVLRFLLPHLDRERGAYGVKESTLAKIYIRILSLPKDGWDAMRLLNYRISTTTSSETADFAEVAYWILKNRCTEGCQLSIEDVNNHLDAIAENHAANEPRKVDAELVSLLKATAAEEQKWLIRILLKDVKVGIGHNGILKCYHPDAKDLFEATNNLRKVSEVLCNRDIRLNEIEVELFSAFKPMLSEECDIQKIDVYFKNSQYFYIETKLDGERFQLHFKEGNYKYFSRNGFDFTSNFGASKHEGTLTPRIASRFRSQVRTCILDGEMMSWNTEAETFSTKANNIDVKSLKNQIHVPCFCVFDILLYNDEVLTNRPLHYRLKILSEIIDPLEGVICFVSRKQIASKEEIIDCLNEAIDNREEGIVMKEYLSVYKPNIRKNGGWYKIKPEYIEGLSDSLDLLIIGGYFGSGRHKGIISHFLLGVAVDIGADRKTFYSVARVGSGYTWVELEKLLSKLQHFWNITKAGVMPPNIEWTKEKPDVWIEPSKSFVLEIKAAEITQSDLFRTGLTLRFPRVLKIREDKSWQDCLTLTELEQKSKMSKGKLASHYLLYSDVESSPPKKKKVKSSIDLAPQFKRINQYPTQISSLLTGKEICVFSGFGEFTKQDIEKKLLEHGANVVLNPEYWSRSEWLMASLLDFMCKTHCGLIQEPCFNLANHSNHFHIHVLTESLVLTASDSKGMMISHLGAPERNNTYCILAESASTARIKNIIKCGSHDIIYASWFVSQLEKGVNDFPTLEPINFLAISNETKLKFSESYDEYGDHFTEPISRETLQILLKRIKHEHEVNLMEKLNLDLKLYSTTNNPYNIFRSCLAYFDQFATLSNPSGEYLPALSIFECDFRFRGGNVTKILGDDVTHVVLFSGDLSRMDSIKRINERRKIKFSIVTEKWIQLSIRNNTLEDINQIEVV